ncbi:MAG: hypothetical protein JO296_07820 [Pseudonocardiales bacterium]|nr:hypothetical protein [Pseudonocardiales bacterium]MBV9650029.1 hypothetical protein [Pseudonocardiales bacterium]
MTVIASAPDGSSAQPSPEATSSSDHAGQQETSTLKNTDFEAAAALPQFMKVVGTIVAPTTLLTALMFYFGLMFAIGYFRYFGVNWTVLNLPVQDYLILSASSGIIPLMYLAGIMLVVIWLYQLPLHKLSTRTRHIVLQVLMPFVAITGLFLLGVAMVDVWYPILGLSFPLETRGISLSIGVLLLAYAARLRRMLAVKQRAVPSPPHVPVGMIVTKWGAVFILISVGLFWAVSSYALNVGATKAQGLAGALSCETDVVLYSEKSLNLHAPGVREEGKQSSDAAYPFRYEGLKLLPQSGNMYLFVPANWTYGKGVAMLLPRSDKIRLEFSQPMGAQNGMC